jgi:hypothetical protein
MPSVLPTTLEEVLKAVILADGPLADYFDAQGRVLEDALFPRATTTGTPKDILGSTTPTPFLVLELGGSPGNYVIYSDFTVRVYDDPKQRYWRIEDIINLVQRAFAEYADNTLPKTQDGYDQWQTVRRRYVSPRLVDPDWQKNQKYIQFDVFGL